jgi:hypothetical protein
MNEIIISGLNKSAPSTWAEVTSNQLITWSKICAKKIDREQALMFVSKLFYGIKTKMFFSLNSAQKIQLADTLAFLLENKLYNWLIPELHFRFRKTFHGPANRLSTSSILEFSVSEFHYSAFKKTSDERYLDLLISALYRPASKKNNGKDFRAIFTELDCKSNAGLISKLPAAVRASILFNYEGCRSFIVKKYPLIFVPGEGSENNKLPDLGPLIKTVAGSKFGSYNETEGTNLYTFLDHLQDEMDKVKEMESKSKR